MSDSVFVAWYDGGRVGRLRKVVGGGWKAMQAAITLKNPLLIDFKWCNIDLCLVQGLAEQATAIYWRCKAGHPVLLSTISHSDTGENERKRGKRKEKRGMRRGRGTNEWFNL